MTEQEPLTAVQLIERLATLPPDTIVTLTESDSERMRYYVYGIADVHESGALHQSRILRSGDDG